METTVRSVVQRLAVAIMVAACSKAAEPEQMGAMTGIHSARVVRVATVREQAEQTHLRLPGVTRATQHGRQSFPHAGYLAQRLVTRGETVVEGQLLAVLSNPELGPGVMAAEARVREMNENYQQLRSETERIESLFGRKQASADERDRVRARRNAAEESLTQAKAQLVEAQGQLADAELRAPFAGIVVDLLVEPGEFLRAGDPVLMLNGSDGLEVQIHLPQERATHLYLGYPVRVTQQESGRVIEGSIAQIGDAMPGLPAAVIVALPDAHRSGWRAGETVQVDLVWQGESVVQVPLAAILDAGAGLSRVFLVVNGLVNAVPVNTGRLNAGWVTVTGDVRAGDQLVVAGHNRLLDGEAVRALP